MIEKSSTLFGWHDEQNLQGPPPQFMLRRQRALQGQDRMLRRASRIGVAYAQAILNSTEMKKMHPDDHRANIFERCMESHCGEYKNSSGVWIQRTIVNSAIDAALQHLNDNNCFLKRGIHHLTRDRMVRGLDEWESVDAVREAQLARDAKEVQDEIVRRERKLNDLKAARARERIQKAAIELIPSKMQHI